MPMPMPMRLRCQPQWFPPLSDDPISGAPVGLFPNRCK